MTRLLASVRTADEALAALAGGADILDLKEPAAGALGRLPDAAIRGILAAVAGQRPTSATIGDMALAPEPVSAAVAAMAALGVDIVKIGIFAGDLGATLAALAPLARRHPLVAVVFADRSPEAALVARFAGAGFHGVMLDTAEKAAGPLTRHLPLAFLRDFVARAQGAGMIAGLAGSLAVQDVAALAPLGPDYLGFRSALTRGGRAGPLDPAAVRRVRVALDQASASSSATAAAGAQSAASSARAGEAGMSAAKLV